MAEVAEDTILKTILRVFPDAELAGDDDGQLVVNTNCMWSGKNGEHVLGNFFLLDDVVDEAPDSMVHATIDIFDRDDQWWMTITGDLFGPFASEDEAIDNLPACLRETF